MGQEPPVTPAEYWQCRLKKVWDGDLNLKSRLQGFCWSLHGDTTDEVSGEAWLRVEVVVVAGQWAKDTVE